MKKRTTENEVLTAIRFVSYPGGDIENAIADLVSHRGLNVCWCDGCEAARAILPQTIFENKKEVVAREEKRDDNKEPI